MKNHTLSMSNSPNPLLTSLDMTANDIQLLLETLDTAKSTGLDIRKPCAEFLAPSTKTVFFSISLNDRLNGNIKPILIKKKKVALNSLTALF